MNRSSLQTSSENPMACAILSFNHPEITERTIRSVLEFHPCASTFLIHNGSEPRWVKQHQKTFPTIHHLILTDNRGFSGGVNFAFTHLFKSFAWVFLITNDCQLLTPLHPPHRPGLYGPLIYRRKISQIDSMGGVFYPAKAKLIHAKTEDTFFETFTSKTMYPYIPGTAFWLHRELFQQVGDFDESLHTYWEDVDFSVRAKNLGLHLDLHTSTQLIHAVGKTCHKHSFYTQYLFKRNRRKISLKYCPVQQKPLLYLQLAGEAIRSFWRRLRQSSPSHPSE